MQPGPVNIADRPKKLQSKKTGGSHKAKKHQNEKAYKLMYNDRLIGLKENTDIGRLCKECFPIIKWKLEFGKYKVRTTPGKCNSCEAKNVIKSYRHVCDKCCDEKKICSKCGDSTTTGGYHHQSQPKKTTAEMSAASNVFMGRLSKLQERSRRKVLRLRDEDKCVFKNDTYWNKEEDREVSCLKWRREKEEDDEDSEEDSEDDSDEEGEKKKVKKVEVKKEVKDVLKEGLAEEGKTEEKKEEKKKVQVKKDEDSDDEGDSEDDDSDEDDDDESSEEKPKKGQAKAKQGVKK